MARDLLAGSSWQCCATPAGLLTGPDQLEGPALGWQAAAVPGTAAGAARSAGVSDPSARDYDSEDWWFRCRFDGPSEPGPWILHLGGLATIADVWLNGNHILHSENMFLAHPLDVEHLDAANDLVIRCSALRPFLDIKRPRPRWKSYMVAHQNLRWVRTALLGRIPGWAVTPPIVGPWRPVELRRRDALGVIERRMRTACDGAGGMVELALRLERPETSPAVAVVQVGDRRQELPVRVEDDALTIEGIVWLPEVDRWWPHSHGDQPLYPVSITIGDHRIDLGKVGFRTVRVDRSDGGFQVVVNEVPVFCRGACWFPLDPVSMVNSDQELRSALQLARAANMNMVRVPGTTAYEDTRFWDLCDELGLLVWQDCMFAFLDSPEDEGFVSSVEAELIDNLGRLGAHPALALVCGSQEVEEIAAMMGLPRHRWTFPMIEKIVPAVVARLLPDIPYITSNPTGGDLPFEMDVGVSQYFGVGGYLRPISDVRRTGVRFAAECLCFATPPERQSVEDIFGGATPAGHDPAWKRAVHHDAGRSWDMEDVRDHYMRAAFDVDPLRERYVDPERALDLGRATNAELMAAVFSEWRRPASTCSGGLVLGFRDLRPGAGWGVVDALGRPKAPWFTLRRVLQPLAVVLTDEGLNGLALHVVNDTSVPFEGTLRVALYGRGELRVDEGQQAVTVPARSGITTEAGRFFDGFRDVSYAYRFSPPAHDVVVATLVDRAGQVVSEAIHLPLGLGRPVEPDVGLSAVARPAAGGIWDLTVSTRRFAEYTVIDVDGYVPSDSWFHLAPGATRSVALTPVGDVASPHGYVRALNAQALASIAVAPAVSA